MKTIEIKIDNKIQRVFNSKWELIRFLTGEEPKQIKFTKSVLRGMKQIENPKTRVRMTMAETKAMLLDE
jgi:hypothetical protein